VVVWGATFLRARLNSIRHRSPNMFTLIALGIGAAYIYSVIATLAPASSRRPSRRMGGYAYFETAAVITTGSARQVLELRARRRTQSALRATVNLQPAMAGASRPTATRWTCRWRTCTA
jgi:Cu+-exporting ATPase